MTTTEPLHVLVVEDDADTRANLCDILELDQCRVSTSATAAEALAERDWSDISVVILDRKLPDGTAEELLPKLRKLAPLADLIVATGYADVDGAIAALRHGATDYLIKPIQIEMLRATLARIVERRALARDNRQHLHAFQAVVETSPCLVVILRFDHRVAYLNQFTQELTGFSFDDVKGDDYCERFLTSEDHAAARQQLELLRRGEPIRGYENRVLCRDGSYRWVVWNANLLADYEGEPAILAIGVDITDRKRSEERAKQTERLAAIGETMTALVHESRNALQRSMACLEMLELEVQDRPEALDLVVRIQRAQKDLQQLYEEVRQYAAPVKLERSRTHLPDLWREIWDDLETAHTARKLRLVEQLDHGDGNCDVDRFALGRVWRNILENAIQVSPEGSEIIVRCSVIRHHGRTAIRIAFRDHGPGLTAEQRRRIFEPFFTTKSKGTGLGMAIAQRIIASHGGDIEVGEPMGPGAEIVVTLPMNDGPENDS